jgi:heme/copper-type cytochrome/quinol oxidase subunit 3
MIPYTIERRSDTGVTNVTMGIWLFLASEVMLFGALFSAYALLRVSAVNWPPGRDILNVGFGGANTAILLVMTGFAWRARSVGDVATGGRRLLVASILAVTFLAVKSVEYSSELGRGLAPSVSTFLAMYFTLTGLHALHVVCGLVANVWALTGTSRVSREMTAGRLRALALYWAFVDVIWMIIFVLMYLS